MESHFEINVSKDGKHLFATAPRSLPDCQPRRMEELLAIFTEKFPESEGYHIDVTDWKIVGHVIHGDEYYTRRK